MKVGVLRILVLGVLAPWWIAAGHAAAAVIDAAYDASLGAPACDGTGSGCDSGALLVGRGPIGPEPHAPNTLGGACADGSSGSFHLDESLDRLMVATTDGSLMRPGQEATVSATVWAFGPQDVLDVYYATDALAPEWSLVGTTMAVGTGAQVLDVPFVVAPGAARQALRGVLRYGNEPSPSVPACTIGAFDDHDDLVFAVGSADPGVAAYDATLRTPRCLEFGALCDSTSLLTGRGVTGPEPHQPNTTEDSCADGLSGVFHADSSVDRLRLSTATGVVAQGDTAQLAITVFASADYADEHVDIFEIDELSLPDSWRYLGSVAPTGPGLQTLSFPYAVATGPANRALRASYRSSSPAGGDACVIDDPWVDHDDLWFRVDAAAGAHALTVDGTVTGGGGGQIEIQSQGGPALASCPVAPDAPPWPAGCSLEVSEGAAVLLTPLPQPDARFAGWTGACAGTAPCLLTMSEARWVGATFAPADTLEIDDATSAEGADGTSTMTFTVTLSRVE